MGKANGGRKLFAPTGTASRPLTESAKGILIVFTPVVTDPVTCTAPRLDSGGCAAWPSYSVPIRMALRLLLGAPPVTEITMVWPPPAAKGPLVRPPELTTEPETVMSICCPGGDWASTTYACQLYP